MNEPFPPGAQQASNIFSSAQNLITYFATVGRSPNSLSKIEVWKSCLSNALLAYLYPFVSSKRLCVAKNILLNALCDLPERDLLPRNLFFWSITIFSSGGKPGFGILSLLTHLAKTIPGNLLTQSHCQILMSNKTFTGMSFNAICRGSTRNLSSSFCLILGLFYSANQCHSPFPPGYGRLICDGFSHTGSPIP